VRSTDMWTGGRRRARGFTWVRRARSVIRLVGVLPSVVEGVCDDGVDLLRRTVSAGYLRYIAIFWSFVYGIELNLVHLSRWVGGSHVLDKFGGR